MREVVRRSIAYAAALQIADRSPGALLSRQGRDRSPMSEMHDARTGYRLSALRSRRFLLHDLNTRVVFDRLGARFNGWVELSGDRYSGAVSGNIVTIYDQKVGLHFQYELA